MFEKEIVFKQYLDTKDIKDSMQIDSNTVIATLKTPKHFISLEVKGFVTVDWEGERFTQPSSFPQELKDLIAGNTEIINNGTIISEKPWFDLDDRLDIIENNWFEVFVGEDESDSAPWSDVVDVEGLNSAELLSLLMEFDEED